MFLSNPDSVINPPVYLRDVQMQLMLKSQMDQIQVQHVCNNLQMLHIIYSCELSFSSL